jgi:hypothetical protein
MRRKVKVDVFGKSRDPRTGQNSLPLKKYFSLVKYLENSDMIDKVDLHFTDPTEVSMASYPAVQKALQQGKPEPIVVIDGVVKYFGNIPYEAVYQDVKKLSSREF